MTTTRSVTLERFYPATPEQVWTAWTDPEVLARWYGCRPDQLWTIHEWDARPGGTLRVSMDFDGERFEVLGTFLVVEPPSRLQYSFGERITIAVRIEPDGDETKVTVTHHGLPDEEMAGIVTDGWTSSLSQLGHEWTLAAADDQPSAGRRPSTT